MHWTHVVFVSDYLRFMLVGERKEKLWTKMGFKYLTDDILAGFDKYRVICTDLIMPYSIVTKN